MPTKAELAATIAERMLRACQHDPRNRFPDQPEVRIYDDLLIGVAAAADPLYGQLKDDEVVGPHHLSPAEWLPGALSVVSYFLPYSAAVRTPNRVAGMPAPEWIIGRFEGEAFNDHLRGELARWSIELGGEAVIPAKTPSYRVVNRRASWSERHTAFIAGLGTFGLSRSLLTARGSAGRFGSVITTLDLEPTPRDYEWVYDRCPWLVNGRCGACIDRCPAGAIRPEGKDIPSCAAYLDEVVKAVWAPRYGCGKCQTGVPCEATIPSLDTPVMFRRDE